MCVGVDTLHRRVPSENDAGDTGAWRDHDVAHPPHGRLGPCHVFPDHDDGTFLVRKASFE